MLRTIPPILTPDLLWTLAAMGHGDQLALVNANYPAWSKHGRVICLPGVSLADAAAAILHLMPLDDLMGSPACFMIPDGAPHDSLDVHRDLQCVLNQTQGRAVAMQPLVRTQFFERAERAFAAVSTTDNRPFGCFLLTKGVIPASKPNSKE